jgi:hypothetical protein
MNRASSKPPSFCFSDAKGLEIRLHSRYRVEVNRHSSLPRGEAFFNIESFSNIRGPKATFDALNIKQRAEYEHRVNSSQVETQAARKRRRL